MSSDDELLQDFNKKLEELKLDYKSKTGKDLPSKLLPKENNEEDSSDEELPPPVETSPEPKVVNKEDKGAPAKQTRKRINADITYTAMIDGKEKTYKYRTSLLRAKYLSAQRDNYKKVCRAKGMEFINDMFVLISGYHWKVIGKYYIGVEEDKIEEPVDLVEYYRTQPQEVQDEIFRKKPYYKNYIK